MRKAMNRVIETFKLHQCNICGNDAIQGFGENIDIVLSDRIIKIWECADCIFLKEEKDNL